MLIPGEESARPGLRARALHVWELAGTPARVLIAAWLLLPLVIVLGLTRLPWDAPNGTVTPSDPNRAVHQRITALDDDAKADIGTLGALMEECFSRRRDFTACDTPAELPRAVAAGIEFGRGPNKVAVAAVSPDSYALIGTSRTGATFMLARHRDGRLHHACPDIERGVGGCSPQGTW